MVRYKSLLQLLNLIHPFYPTSIDRALSSGRGQCPVCKSQIVSGSSFTPLYFRIYPSKSENRDNQECINLKKKLAEANQKIATLQLDLSDTKSTLNTSRQAQNATSSQLKETKISLEKSTKSMEKLKKDIEHVKRAKDECYKRNDKLKATNQNLANNLKASESLCQTLREQLASRDAQLDSLTVLDNAVSPADDSKTIQVSQKGYLDLKKNYQNLVIREKLVEKKLTDLTLQQEGSNYTENLVNTQRLYKQLTEALAKEIKLTNVANQIKQEKKDALNEKKALQEKFNGAIRDLKRLQQTEEIWTANTRHLQDVIKKGEQDILELKKLHQDYITERTSLKQSAKSLNESLAASDNNYRQLKRTSDAEKEDLRKSITALRNEITACDTSKRILTNTNRQLALQVNNLECSKRTLHLENANLLKELKTARQPWFSFN